MAFSPVHLKRAASAAVLVLLFAGNTFADDLLVERGRYLSVAADCGSCHMDEAGKAMSGGAALKTPFGKIYPSNVTQDTQTGIGGWTEREFTRAVRDGVRRDGARLYPGIPYDHYTRMTDDDVHALWEYFRSLPATRCTVPANTLAFPFNVRAGLAVWQSAYFKPGRFEATAGKDASWNRGAYLVDALGHCGACHTPKNAAQASEEAHRLTGAQVEGWYAPDISSDALSTLQSQSVAELERFLKTGEGHNAKTFGPMQQVVHDSLQHLDDADIHAMAVYLKDQPANVQPQTAVKPVDLSAQLAAGKLLFEDHCASCHQRNGEGIKGAVPALAGNSAVTAREPFNVVMAMLEGFAPQGSWGAMASFGNTLSDRQIADVANYVRNAWGNHGEHPASPWSVSSLRPAADNPADGTRAALVCPILPASVMQPALKEGAAALKRAASDTGQMQQVVRHYLAARPQASKVEVIEALSAAYCRAQASDTASLAMTGVRMAEFSQEVAISMVTAPTGPKPARLKPAPASAAH